MKLIKLLKSLLNEKNNHFLYVSDNIYYKWKWIIVIVIKLNKNYKSCEIFRKKYKNDSNIVVIGLQYNGKNIRRRTNGFAMNYIEKNDNAICVYCGIDLNKLNATADHIIPISNGGNNCKVNLVVCCRSCNNERGNLSFNKYFKIKKNGLSSYRQFI